MNIMIYSKAQCPYCDRARMLLNSKGIGFTEQKLNEDFSREYLLEQFPNAKTFPVVVIDGFHIGGYTELYKHLNEQTENTQRLLHEGEWDGA